MNKINFEDGQLVSPAYVKEDGTIEEAVYEGKTPLSAHILNEMQDNAEEAINELDPSKLTNEATEVNDEDLLLVVQNGVKKKVPASKVGTGGGATGDTLPIRKYSRLRWRRCTSTVGKKLRKQYKTTKEL